MAVFENPEPGSFDGNIGIEIERGISNVLRTHMNLPRRDVAE